MAHVVRKTDWCDIDINTTTGFVFFQQRWQYNWICASGQGAWTLEQKRRFHNRCDHAIWQAWSYRAKLSVAGTSDFARRFSKTPLSINLDVRWLSAMPHCTVTVTKIAAGGFLTSEVFWTTRKISLDSEDFQTVQKCDSTGLICRSQVPVAHEFGHAAGNTAVLSRGDEYRTTSPHVSDYDSILNIAGTVRSRHFTTILEEMNKMIADTTFSVHSVR
jgi:hypothetical protein